MLTDLERDLRDTLTREAADVDLPAPEWAGPRVDDTPRRSRSRRLLAVAAAAVVAVGIGSLWLGRAPAELSPVEQPGETVPPGLEVHLQPILLDDLRWAPTPFVVGATKPGSFRAYAVDGYQFVVYETIEHRGGPGVVAVRCVEDELTYLACRPSDESGFPIDAGAVWVWPDLPAGTAHVTARTGAGPRWQRPVDGIAAFTGAGSLVALDDDGRVLAHLDAERALAEIIDPRADGAVFDSLGWDSKTKVAVAAMSTALRCLGGHGIAGDPRDPLPAGAPLDDLWNECVAAASAAGAQRFVELGGRVVGTAADDPTRRGEDVRTRNVTVTCVPSPDGGETCTFQYPAPAGP